MKKVVFSILAVCYFAVTSGIVINSHYCMQKLVSVHLFESESDVCGKCGMDLHDNPGCCKEETKLVKLEQDQNKHIFIHPGIESLEAQVITPSEFIARPFLQPVTDQYFLNHSPPLLSAQNSYLQNNVFRI